MGLLDIGELSAKIDAAKRRLVQGLLDPQLTLTRLAEDAQAYGNERLDAYKQALGAATKEGRQQGRDAVVQGMMDGPAGGFFAGKIGDALNWKPLSKVKAELQIDEVPRYIQDTYGQFMKEQSAKAAEGNLGPRDLIKAYGITRSSVQRQAQRFADDLNPTGQAIRPEGYFSEWLLSPAGKAYLDAAERGAVNKEAIADAVNRFKPFGMSDTLGKDLEWAAQNLPQKAEKLPAAVTGTTNDWRTFADEIRGVGPAKKGFIASMLGRGDLPTLDARQIGMHLWNDSRDASRIMQKRGGKVGDTAVDNLARRQERLGLKVDPELSPFYQHLAHHSIWDKTAGTQTTHEDLVRAMRLAGFGGAGLLGLQYNGDE